MLRVVIAQGLRLSFSGVGIGLLTAYATTGLMKALLDGVARPIR